MRRLYNLWLFCGFGAVMAAFALSTFLQYLASDVRQETESLLNNALPSAEYLSDARAELWTVEGEVMALMRAEPGSRKRWSARLGATLRRLDEDIAAEGRTPSYPEEPRLLEEVLARRAELQSAIDEGLAPEAGTVDAVMERLFGYASQLDVALLALTQSNLGGGKQVSRDIDRIWRRSSAAGFLLDLVAASLAVGSMLAFRRVLKRNVELSDLHRRASERRAAELEAFAGRIAHDLRNPLSALSVGASTIERLAEPAGELMNRALERMRAGIRRTDTLIDGLLAFATAGASPALGQRAELLGVMEGVLEDIPPGEGVAAEVNAHPAWVSCSVGALTSVLSNLVQNAVKYTRGLPERRLWISAERHGEAVRIEVADNGRGIPPGLEERVFDPFFRVPGNNEPGLGLGLATVKRIVEGYGGKVGVGHPPRGAALWVELPGAAPEPSNAEQEREGHGVLEGAQPGASTENSRA